MSKKANGPEARAASGERLKKLWQDPEWRAKRLQGIRDSVARGTFGKNRTETLKRMWADPVKRRARLEAMERALNGGTREKHRAVFTALKADPAFEEKRERRAQEFREKNPLRLKVSAIMAARKRRGFDVPRHLWDEYQMLRTRKKMSAREAGAVLGLVRP